MKLAVVTALWQRPAAAAIMLDSLAIQRTYLRAELELHVVAAGSEGKRSRELAESRGAIYVEVANKPLGAKWMRALRRARALKPDAVLVLGSDNIVNDELLLMWSRLISDGVEYVGLYDAYQFNPLQWTLVHWHGYVGERAGEPIGSSRCFSRVLLDRIDWNLWEPSYNRGLDWSATQRLAKVPHQYCFLRQNQLDVRHLGVKLHGAMSPSLHTHRTVTRLDPITLLDWYDEIGARILALSEHCPFPWPPDD